MDFKDILSGLKIKADIHKVENNGTTTKVYLRLHPGSKVSKIESASTEISLGARAYGKPIIRVIPEEGLVVIELLNKNVQNVRFAEFSPWFDFLLINESGDVPIVLGKSHDGNELVIDLAKMPHLLVCGSTGSGKSALLHSMICSLIKAKNDTRLILIDPKQTEFDVYNNVKQLLYPVITSPEDALEVLESLVDEMDHRFDLLNKASVNNIQAYNNDKRHMPYLVLVVDEFADLQRSYKKEFQNKICILSAKARAAGIHMVIATQHPTVDVISGTIKSNFSSRIALKTATAVDSRVILDKGGAEKLVGCGDAFINSGSMNLLRFQSAYISRQEIIALCEENRRQKKWWEHLKW